MVLGYYINYNLNLSARIFRRPIIAKPDSAIKVAACALHNFVKKQDISYCPPGFVDSYDTEGNVTEGQWRTEGNAFVQVPVGKPVNAHTKTAGEVRDAFADYFVSPVGEVEWQYKHVCGT